MSLLAGIAAVMFGVISSISAGDKTPPRPKEGSLAIEYIAHACFRIHTADGHRVLIDPYASRVWIGYDLPDVEDLEADLVLISHPHFDHDAGVSVGREFPWAETPTLRAAGAKKLGNLRIEGIAGRHARDYGRSFGHRNTIWLLEADGIRIAHLGDNGPLTDRNLEALGRVDVLMIPVDAREHILTFDEVDGIRASVKPRILVPMHYRHPDIEPNSAEELDLGDIDPWLEGRRNVRRLRSNIRIIRAGELPKSAEIWVFPNSPRVSN